MNLTARAQSLLKPLQDALNSLNELLSAADFDPSVAKRRFRLSLSDYASRIILPSLMTYIRKEAPGVDLAISQASRETMVGQLLDGELDLALGIFPEVPAEIATQELFHESFVSIADRSALPAKGGLSLNDWLARPHVMVAMRPDANDEIERALSSQGLERRIALALPHWSAAVEVVAGTDLILTVAKRAVGSLKQLKTLRQFEPPFAIPAFSYQQAWHTRKEGDPAHRWLRRAVFSCSQP
jgi:DNA-binding transcriptional LysR family regulator